MDNSGHWLPNQDLLWQCGQIFLAEVAIDVAKHAVVGKFNEIRPGVYREFMKVSIALTHTCLSLSKWPEARWLRPFCHLATWPVYMSALASRSSCFPN